MAGVLKCWTGGPGVQVDPTDNVVSLGDRYGPVIRLGSRRVLTDEQCVDLREQILSRPWSLTFRECVGRSQTMA